jgi:transposase
LLHLEPGSIVKEHTDQQDWLTVERFPAYAPELNPVEYLWSSVKGKDVANLCSDALWQVEQKQLAE